MKKILIISRSWPPHECSGVSLAARNHANILIDQGFEVAVLGSQYPMDFIGARSSSAELVNAKGSGAIYSPCRIDRQELRQAITRAKPDLVLIEAWQTALNDTSIEVAHELGLPILMVSHGISIHPHEKSLLQLLRSLAWLPYRFFKLPRLIQKLTAITALDLDSQSRRFFDRELAKKMKVPLFALKNSPINWSEQFIPKIKRRREILVVGYFSAVKNQMAAIKLIHSLSPEINLCFIGERKGSYFAKCQKAVRVYGLVDRISFLQDDECDLGIKIASCLLVFSPSITEALPMVLIEAMACGTPFVATSVGAVPSLKGGIIANTALSQLDAINRLIEDDLVWGCNSNAGLGQYQDEFSGARIAQQLVHAVRSTINIKAKS